jgi:iron complex transport system substrate-binding protein
VDDAAERLGGARVLSLDPVSLDDVLDNIEELGEAAGRPDASAELVASLRSRLAAIGSRVAGLEQPRVACLEWFDPIYAAGHWVPEQVRIAGGREVLGREASPSVTVEWEVVAGLAPEVLVLMPCGLNASEAADRLSELSSRGGWSDLPAVRYGRVFAVDASSYFSRPGPRLIDGVELLAEILHGKPPEDAGDVHGMGSHTPGDARRVIRLQEWQGPTAA